MDNQICEKFKNKDLISILIVVVGLFLLTLTVSTIFDIQNKATETKNTLVVTATGEVYAKPDLALATASVITEAKTVAGALKDNTEKMNAVIDFIKGQGVEDKDLKTTNFNIYPRYEYKAVETDIYPYPPGKRVLVGYEVSQSLQIKIRDLEKIGTIIEGATNAGANEMSDLQFTIDKEDDLKNQARDEAISEAKTKAKELAKQLGINLIRISNFSESGVMPYYYGLKEAAPMGIGGGGETPQIQTGENKIEVTVTLIYDIN